MTTFPFLHKALFDNFIKVYKYTLKLGDVYFTAHIVGLLNMERNVLPPFVKLRLSRNYEECKPFLAILVTSYI